MESWYADDAYVAALMQSDEQEAAQPMIWHDNLFHTGCS